MQMLLNLHIVATLTQYHINIPDVTVLLLSYPQPTTANTQFLLQFPIYFNMTYDTCSLLTSHSLAQDLALPLNVWFNQ